MKILTSTCGWLMKEPCVPEILENLLIHQAQYNFFNYEVGKMLYQQVLFENSSLEIFHTFSHVDDDYTFQIKPQTTYLLINLTNTFSALIDQSQVMLYENGFMFFESKQGKILWKASSAHEYKFILIALTDSLKEGLITQFPLFLKKVQKFPSTKWEFIPKYVITPKMLNIFQAIEETKDVQVREKWMRIMLSHCVEKLFEKPFPHASKLKKEEIETIYVFKHILRYQMQMAISIFDISQHLGLNERRLRTGFRRVYGVSIFEYLLYLRMENAMKLIEHSNIKINKIANLVGYQSKFTFAAAFRKYFKNKPSFTRRLKTANIS